MSDYELGIIGAGNMSEAILRGVIGSGTLDPGSIVVSDPLGGRLEKLAGELQVAVTTDNLAAAACPRVVLAVKPQVMGEVLDGIAGAVSSDTLVVSIAAGIATGFIDERLSGRARIVRVMPNTPMLVGAGVSAIVAGPGATEEDLHWTEQLFAASGQVVIVDEPMMDAVTAVSGSGPAYFFYLVEAMIEAGVAEGLPRKTAQALATQTCLGAGKLLVDSTEDPAELRRRVTSPGGTTQRAIETMDTDGVKDALVRAIRAAAERSRELGG